MFTRTRGRQLAALFGLILLLTAFAPLPAGAEESTVTGSWYWAEQPDPLPPPIGAPAALPAPDVPSGDFAVAARPASQPAQQSDKETYLHVDVSAAPAGATLSTLSLKLKEDTAGGNLNAAAAVIQAHLVTEFFADGAAGSPYSQRPKFDATAAVKGSRGGDGTWTFDLSSLVAGKDAATFFGIAMVPAPAAQSDAFEVVWAGQGANAPTATYTVSGGAPESSGGFAPAAGSLGGSSGTGGGSFLSAPVTSPPTTAPSSPSSPSSAGSGSSFSSPSSPLAPTGSEPASSGGAAGTPSATSSAPSSPSGLPASRAAASRTKRGIPWSFVAAGLALIALLALSGIALGQRGEPLPARTGSVVRRLERPADGTA